MPHRRRARPDHARPIRIPDRRSPFPAGLDLPLDGGRRTRLTRLRRGLVPIAIGVLLAVAGPPVLGALGPANTPLQPLGGGVAGAISGSSEAPSIAPDEASARPPGSAPPLGSHPATGDTAGSGRSTRRDLDGPPVQAHPTAPPLASLTGYVWPIAVGRISLPFKAIPGGEWINNGKRFHDGVDMASFCGADVRAAHDGVVLAAGRRFDEQIGWIGDLGPYFHRLDVHHTWSELPIVVVIDDGNGYRSIYAHFRDVTVKVGQRVTAGQRIGHEGATGHASGCHVHYGLFSPFETKTFTVRADIVRRMLLPTHEIARVDPLAVLPGGDVALRTRSIAKAIAAATAEVAATRAARMGPMPGMSAAR